MDKTGEPVTEQPPAYNNPGYPPAQPQPGYPPAQPQPGYPPAPQPGYAQPPGGYPPQQPYPPTHTTTTTNVVVVQQQPTGPQFRQWNSGLCACFDDCGSCCMGYFCPFWLLLDVSSRMGEGCCFPCCCPGALLGLRIKLRVEQNIQGSLMDDYCVVQCCPLCVMCQLSRELKSLGR